MISQPDEAAGATRGNLMASGAAHARSSEPNHPQRVLMISGQAEHYGADRSLANLALAIARRGWQVTVTLPGPGPLAADMDAAGIPTVRFEPGVLRRVNRPRDWARLVASDMPAAIWRARRMAGHYDIVHVNSVVVTGALLGAALSGRATVCHVRESFAAHPRLFALYARLLQRLPVTYVAVSTAIADELARAGLGEKTVTVPNGIDLSAFPPPPPDAPRQCGVLCVGRINDWKGQDVLVKAIARLRDRGVKIPLSIAGDVYPGGEIYRRRLEHMIADLGLSGQVQLLGFVEDVGRLLTSHTIYVQPSIRPEPFGLALVEAMTQGMACIASRGGGPSEIIRHGTTGLLVNPGDASELADAIGELWRDPGRRQHLGSAAMIDARQRFSAESEAGRIAALYSTFMDDAAPP